MPSLDTAQVILAEIATTHSLSDSEIAKMVGSSQPTIWRVKNGKVGACSLPLYMALHKLREDLASGAVRKEAA